MYYNFDTLYIILYLQIFLFLNFLKMHKNIDYKKLADFYANSHFCDDNLKGRCRFILSVKYH